MRLTVSGEENPVEKGSQHGTLYSNLVDIQKNGRERPTLLDFRKPLSL